MSHIHSLHDPLSNATQYQAYLARLQSERTDDGETRVRRRAQVKGFTLAVDPDASGREEPGRDPEGEERPPSGDEEPPGDAFGKHYA